MVGMAIGSSASWLIKSAVRGDTREQENSLRIMSILIMSQLSYVDGRQCHCQSRTGVKHREVWDSELNC